MKQVMTKTTNKDVVLYVETDKVEDLTKGTNQTTSPF